MSRTNQAMRDLLRYNGAILPRERSRFNKSHSHTTTFDSGYLVPLFWDRVLPGDEKELQFSGLCRMATPIHPVMDNAKLEVACFFVPDRLWWNHAKEFYGENLDADFNEDGEYIMPYLNSDRWAVKNSSNRLTGGLFSLNDYFGFPVLSTQTAKDKKENPDYYASAGLHRCYQLIWNDWFRNSSIQEALTLNDGDSVSDAEWNVIREIRMVNKLPDYFTTLLREPQYGEDVMIPLDEFAPVVAIAGQYNDNVTPLHYVTSSGSSINSGNTILGYSSSAQISVAAVDSSDRIGQVQGVTPNNLYAQLDAMTTATIANLRSAVTIQHFKEITNIAGRRFQSIIKAHFGTFTPDSTLQRPELLGLSTTNLNMRQVIQTSETSDTSPLGNVAAVSVTNVDNAYIANKAFTEPGFIMALGWVRPEVSWSQGLNPLLTKLSTYEHYWPCFDHISNQPVYKHNIYAEAGITDVFGYAPAWVEYRTMLNRVTGLMRPDVEGTLSSWNYSVLFNGVPSLNSEFIQVDPMLIDRTIATPDEPQFICDCWFEYKDTKAMSVHSIPGIDHF